jgi:vacuolar-type H+-ATPase subunit H
MNARVELPASPEVDAAIMRVLEAEQAARSAVDGCRRDAERIVEGAQRRARAIAERAARRAARVHHWTDRAIASRVAELESQRAALLGSRAEDDDGTALLRAVELLADELTGARA